jgi:hypothetical protein
VEPIASTGAGAVFRPTGAGTSEVQALLRDGRVLRAEVLQLSAEGTVLLAIGRQRIPAETELRLDPGASFLVRVEEGTQGIVLRWLAPEGDEAALLRALRAVVGQGGRLGETLGELGRALHAAGGEAELAPELRALARGLAELLGRAAGGAGRLGTYFSALGLGHEAALAALLGARGGRAALAELREDLKALLLRAGSALEGGGSEHGRLREAVARALTSLEAEQLLNLARERAGEPMLWSLPFPDGDGWCTARLSVPARDEHTGGEPRGEAAPFRMVLGLELSSLGPLRAELTLTPSLLAVRLLVTRAEVARRLEQELGELRARLAGGRRAVELAVRIGTPAEAELGLEPLDTRYLREHNLMDVVG